MPATDAPPAFDAAQLIADLRKGDDAAISEAYYRTFGTDLGRLVLADILATAGVGAPFGALSADNIHYRAGAHDGALAIAERAKFDHASRVVAHLTAELEGNSTDDRSFNHAADGSAFLDEF